VPDLELGRTARFHWLDPFHPATAARMRAAAPRLVRPYVGRPARIGYFSDNEVGWWNGALFAYYLERPPTNHTKRRLVRLLRAHYADDWSRLARDFTPPAGVDPLPSPPPGRRPPPLPRARPRPPPVRRSPAPPPLLQPRPPCPPRRRSRRAHLRRPAADLLRPGGRPRDGAVGRCDRDQLQRRQSRRLDRALLLRGATPAERQAGPRFG